MGKHTDTGWFFCLYYLVFHHLPYPGGKKIETAKSIRIQLPYYLKRKLSYRLFLILAGSLFAFTIHAQNNTDTTVGATIDTTAPAEDYDSVQEESTSYYSDTLRRDLPFL